MPGQLEIPGIRQLERSLSTGDIPRILKRPDAALLVNLLRSADPGELVGMAEIGLADGASLIRKDFMAVTRRRARARYNVRVASPPTGFRSRRNQKLRRSFTILRGAARGRAVPGVVTVGYGGPGARQAHLIEYGAENVGRERTRPLRKKHLGRRRTTGTRGQRLYHQPEPERRIVGRRILERSLSRRWPAIADKAISRLAVEWQRYWEDLSSGKRTTRTRAVVRGVQSVTAQQRRIPLR